MKARMRMDRTGSVTAKNQWSIRADRGAPPPRKKKKSVAETENAHKGRNVLWREKHGCLGRAYDEDGVSDSGRTRTRPAAAADRPAGRTKQLKMLALCFLATTRCSTMPFFGVRTSCHAVPCCYTVIPFVLSSTQQKRTPILDSSIPVSVKKVKQRMSAICLIEDIRTNYHVN